MTRSAPRPPPSFKVYLYYRLIRFSKILFSLSNAWDFRFYQVDRPALFLVKDDVSKLILFIGRLANPAQK